MRILNIENRTRIKKAIPRIERKLKIKLQPFKGHVKISGAETVEFVAEQILQAIDFGFVTEDALQLSKPENILEFLNIKEYTKKRNLEEVRSRVIGTEGRAKGTIEDLTGSAIVLHGNRVGIIADAGALAITVQAVISLVRGAKHGNVFAFLEKERARARERDDEDLGLRI